MLCFVKETFLLIVLVVVCSIVSFGQGFSAGSNSPPSVTGTYSFISTEGRFSISLPQEFHGFKPVSANSPTGRITGDSYDWAMKEGSFTAGYIDRPEVLDELATAKRMLDSMRDGLVEKAKARGGTFVAERSVSGIGHPGREVRIDFPDGLFIQRIYLVLKRMYLVSAVLHQDQRANETAVVTILDSFRILSDAEVEAAWKRKVSDATPTPLPQEPEAPRLGSDAKDERLKGKVKTVFTESEDLSGTWAVSSRKPSSMEYYNERGNLTKTERYDWKGNLSYIEVYGYIDGDRASKSAYIRHEYDPPPMMLPQAPGQPKVTYDNRYSIKLKYKYDENGHLIERSVIGNDGDLKTRCVHDLKNDREEVSCFSKDTLYFKTLEILSDQGDVIERTSYRPKRTQNADFDKDKYSYTYEFDAKGNWIKQTSSKWVTKDGRSHYEPSAVYYRTIAYNQ